MPLHLSRALDRMLELDPSIEYAGPAYHAAAGLLEAYRSCWCFWHAYGFPLDATVLPAARTHDLVRDPTAPLRAGELDLVLPVRRFEGAYSRAFEHFPAEGAILGAWLRYAPRMVGTLKPAAIRAAQRFDDAHLALSGGLIWARYFDGGDDAYRAIACAILRRDRDHRKAGRPMHEEDMVRHDLNVHLRFRSTKGQRSTVISTRLAPRA